MKARLNKQRGTPPILNRARLVRLMQDALPLAGLGEEPGFLNIVVTEKNNMEQMNQEFLEHEGPTDVLTFDLRDEFITDEDCAGEIYVCPFVAKEFAEKFNTSTSWELVLYIVHGMLHLAGEDDLDDAARVSMRAAEARVMAELEKKYDLHSFLPED